MAAVSLKATGFVPWVKWQYHHFGHFVKLIDRFANRFGYRWRGRFVEVLTISHQYSLQLSDQVANNFLYFDIDGLDTNSGLSHPSLQLL